MTYWKISAARAIQHPYTDVPVIQMQVEVNTAGPNEPPLITLSVEVKATSTDQQRREAIQAAIEVWQGSYRPLDEAHQVATSLTGLSGEHS